MMSLRRAFSSATAKTPPSSGKYPLGFTVSATNAGLKKNRSALDMALIVSCSPTTAAAGVFTRNAFAAAPVTVARKILAEEGSLSAVLVNAGCANACTGEAGEKDVWESLDALRNHVKGNAVMLSTGVIGVPLQMGKIRNGISDLTQKMDETHDSWLKCATAIMTTDTFPKLRSKEFVTPNGTYRMAGWSKGAGMIHPNMGTMLAGIFTDASITAPCLQKALSYAVERSFNAISVDGDTSTNDSLLVLANGASKSKLINDVNSAEFKLFQENLTSIAIELAQLIVRDGEGATKLLDIQVDNARSFEEAKLVATSIAKSPLVKTAMFGQDANWGRIVCAIGYSGAPVEPTKVNLRMANDSESVHLFKNGAPFEVFEPSDKERAKRILAGEDIKIRVDLGMGNETARMWTCDLTFDYVKINIDYT